MTLTNKHATVACELPACGRRVTRRKAAPVAVVFDGVRLRGLACSPAHAAELQRGWASRDAHGAQFVAVAA